MPIKEEKFRSESRGKITHNLKEALVKCGLKDGMTLSFHHHLRDGDVVLMRTMEAIQSLGIRGIHLEVSSLSRAHEGLVEYIKDGTITGLGTSGMRGRLAEEISYNNILKKPTIFRTHGGRARAIESGEITLDMAIIAASASDEMGNINGRYGKSRFGSMGYPRVDAKHAKKVVVVTDHIVDYPLSEPSIDQTVVDCVVVVETIGEPEKIASGAIRTDLSEKEIRIATYAAETLIAAGSIQEGFAFQAGSGGVSLAVIKFLKAYMVNNHIRGSFACGGITTALVEMMEEGLFRALLDVQTFDVRAVESLENHKTHIEMSASMYANPCNKGAVVDQLDVAILSATEIDTDFNVNVLTGSGGAIMGALGGHPDVAQGAKLTMITAPLTRKNIPIVRNRVTHIVTPGKDIDILVTDQGIAINPQRTDLIEKLAKTNLPLRSIEELREKAEQSVGPEKVVAYEKEVVGIIQSRYGEILDVIHRVKKDETNPV